MNYVSEAEVIDVIEHKKDIKEYILKLDKKRKYSPGAFVQLTLENVSASDIWPESRTFSIASYQNGMMRFIIKNVGIYTNRIFNELRVGKKCTIKYPFGELFDDKLIDENHIFIAGGVGVTPFIGLVEYFKSRDRLRNVNLFYSAKVECDLIHINELKESLKDHLKVFITKKKTSKYIERRMQISDIEMVLDKKDNSNFYICGPKEFNNEINILLISKGYTKIHMDEWE